MLARVGSSRLSLPYLSLYFTSSQNEADGVVGVEERAVLLSHDVSCFPPYLYSGGCSLCVSLSLLPYIHTFDYPLLSFSRARFNFTLWHMVYPLGEEEEELD